MWQRGHQWHHPNGQTGPLGASHCRSGPFHLQRGHQRTVAGHAHGGEEKHTGVHVERGDRAHNLAHDSAKGPAEVQQRVQGPEGQREDELEVGESQAHHEAVDGGVVVATAARVQQKERQGVADQSQDTHHQVDQGNHNSHLLETRTHNAALVELNWNYVNKFERKFYSALTAKFAVSPCSSCEDSLDKMWSQQFSDRL